MTVKRRTIHQLLRLLGELSAHAKSEGDYSHKTPPVASSESKPCGKLLYCPYDQDKLLRPYNPKHDDDYPAKWRCGVYDVYCPAMECRDHVVDPDAIIDNYLGVGCGRRLREVSATMAAK